MRELKLIDVSLRERVAYATLNRPDKANALNREIWSEIGVLARWADETVEVRVLVLRGAGAHFCAGIDFSLLMEVVGEVAGFPEGYKQEALRARIISLQEAFTALERCRKPVIAAIQGACIGGGVDLVSACDIRYATEDAYFSVKEVDLAIVADIGTLQRLPLIIGEGPTRELAMTGRRLEASEALRLGLVTALFKDQETLDAEIVQRAAAMAQKSPLTLRGVKQVMNHCRGKSVAEGLDYVATWNAAMLLSADTQEVITAMGQRRTPNFEHEPREYDPL